MKDDESKNSLKIMQLKSANKSSSKKIINKNYSLNKFNPVNLSNLMNSKLENSKSIHNKKQNSNNLSYKKNDKDLIYNSNYRFLSDKDIFDKNNDKSLYNLDATRIGPKSSNVLINNFQNTISSKNKSSKKIIKNNSENNFHKKFQTNDFQGIRKSSISINNRNLEDKKKDSLIDDINNYKNNSIKIENINNIQNYNSYHILQKSNSIKKFDEISNRDISHFMNLKTPNSILENKEKVPKSEPRNYQREKKFSFLHNNNELNDINIFGDSNPVKVVVRFRPINTVEDEMLTRNFGRQCVQFKSQDTIEVLNPLNELKTFTFDRVFNTESTQSEIFEKTAKPLIADVLQGYNATIFTYGQSGSGKTYTMYGEDILNEETQGIIPRAISEIFNFISDEKNQEIKFELKFSMLEIYMENLYDLLNPEAKNGELKIKEHSKRGIYVENLSELYITSQEEFLLLIHEAEKYRSVSETSLNKNSSRSHLLFQLQITQKMMDDTEKRGALNLIDLAGSEKVSKTHAMGVTLEEAKKINLSLSNLGNVIYALASNNDYIPYRDSKLTRILQDSLGGNSKTMLIVNCSVHSYNAEETLSTLQFAKRAKKIKNKVRINIKRSTDQLEAIIEYLTEKLRKARNEIENLKINFKDGSCTAAVSANLEFLKEDKIKNTSNNLLRFNNSDLSIYDNNEANFDCSSKEIPKNNFEILSDMNRKNSNTYLDKDKTHLKYSSDFNIRLEQMNNRMDDFSEMKENLNDKFSKINSNFASEKIEYEMVFSKEKKELENSLKKKDKEISELRKEIDNLNNQIYKLKEKIELLSKENSIENLILHAEKSMKEFIGELSDIYDNVRENELNELKEYLVEMKSYQIESDNKFLDLLKDTTELKEADLLEKLNHINQKSNKNADERFIINSHIRNTNNNLPKKSCFLDNKNINYFDYLDSQDKNTLKQNTEKNNINSNNENIDEKEITIFENLDDDLNISINTYNKIGLKNVSSKNTLKLTVKRPLEENIEKNKKILFDDSISNISHNNRFILQNSKEKSINKNRSNLKNKINIPLHKNGLLQGVNNTKSEKIFHTNYVKKTNNLDFEFFEISDKIKETNKLINNPQINDIKIIENYNNLKNENNENSIEKKKMIPNVLVSKLFNTIQYNSNEKLSENASINQNNKIKDENRGTKLLLGNYDFNLSCEALFKKIELKMEKHFENNDKFYKKDHNKDDNNKLSYDKKRLEANKIQYEINEKENDINKVDEKFVNKLILSYKKIFEKNRFYSSKILDDFMKNSNKENIQQQKFEDNNGNSVLYNIKNNYTEENKSTIKTNDKKSEFNLVNNMNLFNNSTIQDDFFSLNDKMDRKDQIKIIKDLENEYNKKSFNFTLNKNLNLVLDDCNNEDDNFGNDTKMFRKLKDGFVKLMLNNIYNEKISLELITRLLLDLKMFNNESLYRKKLNTNLLSFMTIFENYISILEDLKKMKYRREFDENKLYACQNLINNINQVNPTFRNSFGREDSAVIANKNININKSIEQDNYKNLEDVEGVLCVNSLQKIEKIKSEDIYSGKVASTNNLIKRANVNLIKSVPKHPSTLQNNITFSNLAMINSKYSSNPLENSLLFNNNMNNSQTNYTFICHFCNNFNNINLAYNGSYNNINNLNTSQLIPPFKLINNHDANTNSDIINTETINNKSNSPIKKFNSAGLYTKKESAGKLDYTPKNLNEIDNFFKEIHPFKNTEKSHDKDLINNLKNSTILQSCKANQVDLNQINSFNNTPVGINSFNLTSPNNLGNKINFNYNNMNIQNTQFNHYIFTSEREKASVKGKYEILRQSALSNTSNKKINDHGICLSELKILKKENMLYRNCFEAMTNELSNFKFFEKNKEEALEKFYDENRVIFEKEVTCFWKALRVYKEIFLDHIKNKETKINEMSKIFDDMVIGENSILMGNNMNHFGGNDINSIINGDRMDTSRLKEGFLRNLAHKKKNQILNEEINDIKDKNFLKIAEAFYKEEGTATKKLDYVTIEIKDNPDIVNVKYGSGLNKNIPTKSPLNRGFNETLVGDEGVDDLSNEED